MNLIDNAITKTKDLVIRIKDWNLLKEHSDFLRFPNSPNEYFNIPELIEEGKVKAPSTKATLFRFGKALLVDATCSILCAIGASAHFGSISVGLVLGGYCMLGFMVAFGAILAFSYATGRSLVKYDDAKDKLGDLQKAALRQQGFSKEQLEKVSIEELKSANESLKGDTWTVSDRKKFLKKAKAFSPEEFGQKIKNMKTNVKKKELRKRLAEKDEIIKKLEEQLAVLQKNLVSLEKQHKDKLAEKDEITKKLERGLAVSQGNLVSLEKQHNDQLAEKDEIIKKLEEQLAVLQKNLVSLEKQHKDKLAEKKEVAEAASPKEDFPVLPTPDVSQIDSASSGKRNDITTSPLAQSLRSRPGTVGAVFSAAHNSQARRSRPGTVGAVFSAAHNSQARHADS